MDPQDTDFRSTDQRPLTRRELRSKERAETETQQRLRSGTGRTPAEPAPTASGHRPSETVPTPEATAQGADAPLPFAQPSDGVSPDTPAAPAQTPPAASGPAASAPPATAPYTLPPAAPTSAAPTPSSSAPTEAGKPATPRSRPRSGRTLADWPAPVPASSSHLSRGGAPVYEAEQRAAGGVPSASASGNRETSKPQARPSTSKNPIVPTTPGQRVSAGSAAVFAGTAPAAAAAGPSVLRRAEAVRAAADGGDSVPREEPADGGASWDAAHGGRGGGHHSDSALGHHGLGHDAGLGLAEAAPAAAAAGGYGHDGLAHDGFGHDAPVEDGVPHEGIEHAMPDDSTVHEAVFASAEVVKAKPKWSRQFKALLAMGVALVLIVGASFVGAAVLRPILGMDKVTDYPGPGSGQVIVTVQPGSGPRAVAQDMQQQGVIADVDTFLKAFGSTNASLHPGDFTFKKQMKASDAAAILAQESGGKVIYFALSAGMRIGDSLDAIAKASGINRKDLDTLNSQPGQFGLPAQAKNLEGYLAPGEYKLPVGTSAKDILTKLVTATTDELKQDGVTDPAKQYDVLTVASIVQAEGGQADYGNVAGAINNRLKPNDQTNGLIQSDATVTYGLGTKTVQLTDAQKQDASNPYNTYAHTGLPPGPIGSPGAKAVAAAAHPTQNDYLFWVTVNLDTGETKFAKTYAEHQTYVAQYQQWCNANAGKCQ